ncbi:MAG: alkyl hydroperoxide reductase [Bacteroidota bacterium]
MQHANSPSWPRWVLFAAATYNIVWGAWVVLFPWHVFELVGMEQPVYPMIWQSVGMIVGVYGLGYGLAAFDPNRHWPIILVGFLGKVFGPIGFIYHYSIGTFPTAFWWVTLFNDLIWIIPFGLILLRARPWQVSDGFALGATPSPKRP